LPHGPSGAKPKHQRIAGSAATAAAHLARDSTDTLGRVASRSSLSVLVFLSAGGLLGLGVVSLWHALRSAENASRAEALDRATTTRNDLRAVTGTSKLLAILPPECRFVLEPAGVRPIPEIAWANPARPSPAAPSARLETMLERIDELEFENGKPDEALALARSTLTASDLVDVEETTLRLRAAWIAHRNDRSGVRDALLAPLVERGGRLSVSARQSLVLLLAESGAALPSWADELVCELPPARAAAMLARLRELRDSDADRTRIEALAARARIAAWWQAVAEIVERDRETLLARTEPWLETRGDRVLLYFPYEAGGAGALLSCERLLDCLRSAEPWPDGLARIRWQGHVELGTRSDNAIPLWPGAWVVPGGPVAVGPLANPWILGALLVVLGLLLALGLVLLFRDVRRERRAVALRNEFLTSVTHELKTPLASIQMFSEMLLDGRVASDERRRAYYRLLAGETGRLTALVDNVLDLGRIERGERVYDLAPLDLDSVLAEAVELFAPVASSDGIVVAYERSAQSVPILGDKEALVQASLNLMENTRKYAHDSGTLDVQVGRERDRVRVSFRDHGPGIAEAERERIFERFQRGREHNGTVPGVGLGLYLARCILRAHGGDVRCRTPVDGGPGADFVWELPLHEARETRP